MIEPDKKANNTNISYEATIAERDVTSASKQLNQILSNS
jgi:hypothetical protein